MERRYFLKSLFGAAIIAAVPKSVVEQIEKLPPPPPPEKDVLEVAKEQIGERKYQPFAIDYYGDKILFIFDDKQLVGHSYNFNLEFKRDVVPIWEDDSDGWNKYLPGLRSWKLKAEEVHWDIPFNKIDILDLFDKKFQCLIKYSNNMRIKGDIYATQFEIDSEIESPTSHNINFEGSGALIIE